MGGLPISSSSGQYSLNLFVDDLLQRITSNITSNAQVIPLFHTFNFLLEADILPRLADDDSGLER